jgi:hypothetical protein
MIKRLVEEKGEQTKGTFWKTYNQLGFICSADLIRIRFGSLDNLANLAGVKFKEPIIIFANKYYRNKGTNEDMILDFIERTYNLNLERHPRIFTKKTFRYPDAIDYENKIIYEVDEHYHTYINQQIKDEKREKEILEIYPDFKFVRINEKDFLEKFKTNLEQQTL